MSAREGRKLFNYYALADRLNMSVSELLMLPASEIDGWFAYLGELNRHAKRS